MEAVFIKDLYDGSISPPGLAVVKKITKIIFKNFINIRVRSPLETRLQQMEIECMNYTKNTQSQI